MLPVCNHAAKVRVFFGQLYTMGRRSVGIDTWKYIPLLKLCFI